MARVMISLEATPPTPPAGMVVVFAKLTGGVWVKDEYGNERQVDLEINDAGTGTREMWSASKTNTEIGAVQTNLNNHIASATAHAAEDITYDNTGSGLPDSDVQGAIDTLSGLAGGNLKAGIVPTGDQDGINDTFVLPGGDSYKPDALSVFLNGQQIDNANVVKIGPGYTSFQITGDNLPNSSLGDSFTITYMLA